MWGRSDTVSNYLRFTFILLSPLLPLLQVDAFLLTVVYGFIRSSDTNNSIQSLTGIYHDTATECP